MFLILKSLIDDNERIVAQMTKAIQEAVEAIQDQTVVAEVQQALENGDIEGAIDAIKMEAGERVLEAAIPSQLRVAFESAAHGAKKDLATQLDTPALNVRFDIVNPEAVQWVRDSAGDLIKDWGDSSKDAIRDLIRESLTATGDDAVDPRQLARNIVDSGIGLMGRDLNAVENFRRGLEEDSDFTDEQIGKKTEALADRYLRARGETIARTEVMRASRAGAQELWTQAQKQGLIGKDAVQVWQNGSDPCDDCESLDDNTAPLDGDFPGEGGDGPPLHPRCTCAVILEPFGKDEEED